MGLQGVVPHHDGEEKRHARQLKEEIVNLAVNIARLTIKLKEMCQDETIYYLEGSKTICCTKENCEKQARELAIALSKNAFEHRKKLILKNARFSGNALSQNGRWGRWCGQRSCGLWAGAFEDTFIEVMKKHAKVKTACFVAEITQAKPYDHGWLEIFGPNGGSVRIDGWWSWGKRQLPDESDAEGEGERPYPRRTPINWIRKYMK